MSSLNTAELPLHKHINPMALLYSIPNKSPLDVVELLRKCGITLLINDPPQPPARPQNPYRELAVGILLQAIEDALYHRGKTQAEAQCWLLEDNDGFPFWCNAIDLNPHIVRKLLCKKLAEGCYNRTNLSHHYRETEAHDATTTIH
jgi:hypothetical protein